MLPNKKDLQSAEVLMNSSDLKEQVSCNFSFGRWGQNLDPSQVFQSEQLVSSADFLIAMTHRQREEEHMGWIQFLIEYSSGESSPAALSDCCSLRYQ